MRKFFAGVHALAVSMSLVAVGKIAIVLKQRQVRDHLFDFITMQTKIITKNINNGVCQNLNFGNFYFYLSQV